MYVCIDVCDESAARFDSILRKVALGGWIDAIATLSVAKCVCSHDIVNDIIIIIIMVVTRRVDHNDRSTC
jgi:hypothetical protein